MRLHFGLFPKYALLIIALVATLLVASGAVGLYFSYRENLDHVVALQQEKAQAAATRIELYIAGIEQQLGWTAFPVVDAGADPMAARRLDYTKLLRQEHAITEVAWIDAQGREQLRISRLAMNREGHAADRGAEPLFADAMAGRVHRSAVSFRKETEPYMTIARRAGAGGGVTAVDVNLKFVWDVVSRIRIGREGIAYVVDRSGTLIAHPDISLVLKKTELAQLPQVAAALAAAAAPDPAPPPSGTGARARDAAGRDVLAAWAPIPALGWTVFVESPRAEAFAPLVDTLLRMAAVLAAGLVLSIGASFVLARRLVRPIRALQDGAARVGAGELDHRIEVATGDELQALAARFNEMADALRASYAGLERKVAERTAELTRALERQRASAEVLGAISGSVASTEPVFEAILHACQHLFEGHLVGLNRVRADGRIELEAYHGPNEAQMRALYPLPQDASSGSGRCIAEGRALQFADTDDAGRVPAAVARGAAIIGFRSIAFAPLVAEGVPIGTLWVGRREPVAFDDQQMALLRSFADQAVIAIQNARLFHELDDKTRQLEAANRHKSEFLANMSHELRTPLNAIIGFSEVLTEQIFGALNDKQMEYLRDIHSSGQHLLALINDVLDLSKIEAGRMELELSCFDLGLLLEHSATLVRERAQRHGLALALDIGDGLGEWVGDARKIKQTVVNLLANAVKFTPNGGRIEVQARRLNGADGLPGTWASIAVRDTGIGIAPQDQARVFEEFRQASGDVLHKAEGTGLGLALVKRFVELHGGRVALDSTPDAGSTFTVTLPQHELEAVR